MEGLLALNKSRNDLTNDLDGQKKHFKKSEIRNPKFEIPRRCSDGK